MFIIMVTMCEMLRHVNKEPLKVHTLMKKKTKPAKMKVITMVQSKNYIDTRKVQVDRNNLYPQKEWKLYAWWFRQ